MSKDSVDNPNQLLADTITLPDLYKKHHWQVAGPTLYQLDLLFDMHYEQQNELVSDVIRRNELQVWFIAEHVVDVPLASAV